VFRPAKFRLAIVALAAGALTLYILKSIGFKPIFLAATTIGWRGFAILYLYQFILFVILGTAWYVLVPASCQARARVFIWARMVRDASSDLLPFSHLGGILLGARTAASHGVLLPVAFGSVVTDVTTEMLAQIAFSAVGVVILMAFAPHNSLTFPLAGSAAVGLLLIILSCAAFVAFQRYGRTFTVKLLSRLLPGAAPVTDAVAGQIAAIYRRPAKVGLSVLFHCAGWVASALSTWIALLLMGVHAHVWTVLAIESLVCAVRSMAFLVPSGLGVQEVAYAAIAPLFGVGAEIGLAVSMLKRARDVAVGLPILMLWHWSGSRGFLAYRPMAARRLRQSS
jgi:glycosyltransferase 2 family protein